MAIHTRAAEEDTFAILREHADRLPAVILHCFSAPDRLEECVERGYLCSFAGNVTYPKATDLQQAARELPADLLLVETDAPYLSPQPLRGKPNEPANVVHTAERSPSCAGSATTSSSARSRRTPRGCSDGDRRRAPPGQPAPPAPLRVRPNRELGQNFLIDDNILGVIGRAADLGAGDVVLEVGGGLGVLSEYLAPRVGHLHVVEVDRTLEPPLAEALEPFANTDAPPRRRRRARPRRRSTRRPRKVVANLPYGVAATVLLKSIAELPGRALWVAMVQREVGERLAAAPGSKAYGATSVLAQLACEVRVLRARPAHGLPPGAERRLG